jgi:hypothetical protein
MPKSLIRQPDTAIILAREVEGMRALRASRFVGKIVRTFSDARCLYILQEPLLGGELHSVVYPPVGPVSGTTPILWEGFRALLFKGVKF